VNAQGRQAGVDRDPLRSFWMGGFEGADHVNGQGRALDMAMANGHVRRAAQDYRAAAALGLRTVRESIGWRVSEPRPGRLDVERLLHLARAAQDSGVQVLWTLMHYGTPPWASMHRDSFVDHFARFAFEVARLLARWHPHEPPVYTPINEISFLAWAATASELLQPDPAGPQVRNDGSTAESGYRLKRRLVRAALAAMDAIHAADPRARFLHVEPLVHVAAPAGEPAQQPLADRISAYQWQAFDMLCGREAPELGGRPDRLDLVGVNHYHSSQWEVPSEKRLSWDSRDSRRRRFSQLLADCWHRYGRPVVVAETGHVGSGRAAWLHDIASEVRTALDAGVPVRGLCLYPLIDRPDWNDPRHWHRSGVWDVVPPSADSPAQEPHRRIPVDPYIHAVRQWQPHLPDRMAGGTPMTTLLVFSHLRWNFVFQRPQQLLTRLAGRYRVVFVEEPLHADGPPRLERTSAGPHIEVVTPYSPVATPGFHDDQLPVLRPLLAQYLRAAGIDDPVLWFYTPMALPLAAALRPRAVVYDCMDELASFKDAPRQLRHRESALMKMADLVLTGGPSLFDAKRDAHGNVHCLPSSVDAAHFDPASLMIGSAAEADVLRLLEGIGRPRLGFFGVIDERLDIDLLAALADRHPDWNLVMVGPVVKIDAAQLPQRANLHWLGQQPYTCLPYLTKQWDVCLLPFALNEATRHISPTKTLEYLAARKPVVSTPVLDVQRLYGEAVLIGESPEAFIACCEQALQERGSAAEQARMARGLELVASTSWDRSAEAAAGWLEQVLAARPEHPHPGASTGAGAEPLVPASVHSTRAQRRVRNLVIGAGPTGLAAALELGEGQARADTLVIEREDRVGGWCRSIEEGGFTFDHAGHIMFSNDAHVLSLYERLLGANLHWQNREAWIWSKNVYTRYPFQGSLYGLPPEVLKECLIGAIEARFGPLKSSDAAQPQGPDRAPPANFEQFIHAVWGSGIARHFAEPYNRKLWTVPLSEMETSWLGGRVPLPDLEQMIDGALRPTPAPMGPNARFGYPLRGGFQALMDGFLPLLNAELALKTSVLQVSPSRRVVRLDDGRSIGFDALISTMPLPLLVKACGDEAPPEVKAAAGALRYVNVRCVNLGIGRADISDKHWIYYPEDTVFHRIFLQGNASPHCNPPGGFGLICEISYGPDKPLPCDGPALTQRVIADCRRVGIIRDDDPVWVAHQVDMPCAYVIYDHARAANVALIRDWLAAFGIELAGRYSEWEYYNSDHAFIAGKRAAQRVRERAEAGAPQAGSVDRLVS